MAMINITEKELDILVNGNLEQSFTQRDNTANYDLSISSSATVNNPTTTESYSTFASENEDGTAYFKDYASYSPISYTVAVSVDQDSHTPVEVHDAYNENDNTGENQIGSVSQGNTGFFNIDGVLALIFNNSSSATGTVFGDVQWELDGVTATGDFSVDNITQS
jgi:hypothetical protein